MSNWMEDYDAELLAKAKADIVKDDAAFAALPLAEQQKIIAEREAKFAEIPEDEDCDEEDDDEDEE